MFMWLMVFFDLPVKSKQERFEANKFRRYLVKDGYIMIQYSVYARICNGLERSEKHCKRLESNLPAAGSIRALQVTDKQYERMKILIGKKRKIEKNDPFQLILF